ncbi:hypothetical protein RIF29_38708 [Crotalaria pallida]|uniref:Uncharacterized protein n=1 Tax=Crotalaria pallida TaxID=3830 RepID=A0AAN9E595_CROPI
MFRRGRGHGGRRGRAGPTRGAMGVVLGALGLKVEARGHEGEQVENLPRMFVANCLNTELNTITLRGKAGNGNGNDVEKVCGLYIGAGNHKITNTWRDFCVEMDIQVGFGLVLEVVDGARNIVFVKIKDQGEDEDDEEDED